MDAAMVGQQGGQIVLGKQSGRAGFADALSRMGIELADEEFNRAFARFKEIADRKVETGEAELRALIEDQTHPPPDDTVGLVSPHVRDNNDVTPAGRPTL